MLSQPPAYHPGDLAPVRLQCTFCMTDITAESQL